MRYITYIILLLAVWNPVSAQIPVDKETDKRQPNLILKPGSGGMLGEEPLDNIAALNFSQAAIGRDLNRYTLYNRKGKAVQLTDYIGKPLLISLIYTSCYHICPTTTQNLARAIKTAYSAVGTDTFNVVTIGFDVRYDTPERMRSFARQQGVSGENNWTFLSTNKSAIESLTSNLGFIFVPSSKGFDHLIQTTIVDEKGKIYRQIYGMDFDPSMLTIALQELVLDRPGELFSLSALVNKVRLYCTKYDPSTGTYRFNYAMIFAMGIGAVILFFVSVVIARVWRENFPSGTS